MTAQNAVMVVALALPVALLLTLLALARQSQKNTFRSRSADAATLVLRREPPLPETASTQPEASSMATLTRRLKDAEAAGELISLAPLYLELARAYLAAGREDDALSALRSAAGLAALHGPKAVHAEARVELAEAAYHAGDLTSACEHWQLARAAYQDDGQSGGAARIGKRMHENGCPTDWVLTDF